MHPHTTSPVHHSEELAELVCSNFFRAMSSDRVSGLFQEELRHLESIIIQSVDKNSIPAGGALTIARGIFNHE
jgi:methylenetetrahydrofolate--tRNA-(uracil-5-)-methyltransferase